MLSLRARFERLVEIHQEKGNSECLPATRALDARLRFRALPHPKLATHLARRSSQTRNGRACAVAMCASCCCAVCERAGNLRVDDVNPLQLGVIGSTDTHAGTPGFVEEDRWLGSMFGIGDLDRTMVRRNFNPGGLVADLGRTEHARGSVRRDAAAGGVRNQRSANPRASSCIAFTAMTCGGDIWRTRCRWAARCRAVQKRCTCRCTPSTIARRCSGSRSSKAASSTAKCRKPSILPGRTMAVPSTSAPTGAYRISIPTYRRSGTRA